MLAAEPHAGKVGAFEGANYEAGATTGPQADCIMFTRNPTSFCRVCAARDRARDRIYTE